MRHWVLDKQHKVIRATLMEWATFMQVPRVRQVGSVRVSGFLVSTIFLGIDHGWEQGPPVLWESMVFGLTAHDIECERCAGSWEQAEEMHKRMVTRVEEALGIEPTQEDARCDEARHDD